jgi:copper chaperone CopZ
MKTIKVFLVIIMITAISNILTAQAPAGTPGKQKTETIKVWGNCEMCKARIEKAVKAEGAATADWNTKTKLLTVAFDPSKTSVDALSKKLALVGHDTEKYRADDKAYNALDDCCKYERRK